MYRPYLSTSAINTPIPSPAPVHPASASMLSTATKWLGTGAWLGPGPRTSYVEQDTSKLPRVEVYANANGWVGAGPFSVPMPPTMAADLGPICETGDGNVSIVDPFTGDVWEMWHATPPGYTPRTAGVPSNRWNCDELRHWPASTTASKGYAKPSTSYQPGTSASRIQLTAGLLVPEDFADCFGSSDPGTAIPHRMRMDGPIASGGSPFPKFVAPAYAGDGHMYDGVPMGAVIQLDPTIDVSKWPSVVALPIPWRWGMMKILRGLQTYGIMPVDSQNSGGDIDCITPATAARGGAHFPAGFKFPWQIAGLPWGKNGIPSDLMPHFRVIDWTKFS